MEHLKEIPFYLRFPEGSIVYEGGNGINLVLFSTRLASILLTAPLRNSRVVGISGRLVSIYLTDGALKVLEQLL